MFNYKNNLEPVTNLVARFVLIVAFMLTAFSVQSEVLVPPQPANQIEIFVESNVNFDESTHLYTYTYTFTSSLSSVQEVWMIGIFVQNEVVDANSPPGWTFEYNPDTRLASWAATDLGAIDLNIPDDGGVPPSPFQLKSGATLSGFSFKSVSSSEPETFFAQGYTPIPVAENEDNFDEEGFEIKLFKDDSFQGETIGPMSSEAYSGNRRPAVDGFLGFTNLTDNNTAFTAPVTIAIEFSLAGEIVDQNSFAATLNGITVTPSFIPNDAFPGDLAATFELGSSPLSLGKNVLITTIKGTVPGTTRTASDTDRITFTVQ